MQIYKIATGQYYSRLKSSHGRCAAFQTRLAFRPFRSSRERRQGRAREGRMEESRLRERAREGQRGREREKKWEIEKTRDERASDVWTPTRAVLITLGRPVLRLCRLEEPEEQPPHRRGSAPFMGRVKK